MTITVSHRRIWAAVTGVILGTDWNDTHVVTGLENVDNTSDANKPVSTAQAAALALKANIATTRERLIANRTYYVRTDGSDGNTGLTNTAGGAFLTIQKAINALASLDLSTFNVTIQVGAGTYTAGASCAGPWLGSGSVTLIGDTTTPSNVVISASGDCIAISNGSVLAVGGFKLVSAAGSAFYVTHQGQLNMNGNMEFGTCGTSHFRVIDGGQVSLGTAYTISGGAQYHYEPNGIGSLIRFQAGAVTVTLTGTPAFTIFTRAIYLGLLVIASVTYSGAATGQYYNVSLNAVIQTFGAGATYFPGNSAGAASAGGQYS